MPFLSLTTIFNFKLSEKVQSAEKPYNEGTYAGKMPRHKFRRKLNTKQRIVLYFAFLGVLTFGLFFSHPRKRSLASSRVILPVKLT
jgi:hypothetical protein